MFASKFSMLSLAVLLTIPLCAQAGTETSGGGNAVVCFDDPKIVSQIKGNKTEGGFHIEDDYISHITSVELLDIHKARLLHLNQNGEVVKPKLIESKLNETQAQYAARIIKRIESLVPEFSAYLAKLKIPLKNFPHGLAAIDDVISGEVMGKNCIRSTIIAQYDEAGKTYAAYDSRIYLLSEAIFPVSSRVLSFWHEYFYSAARAKGVKSSDAVQTLIGSLITEGATLGEIILKIQAATNSEIIIKTFVDVLFNNMVDDFNANNLGFLKEEKQEQAIINGFTLDTKYKNSLTAQLEKNFPASTRTSGALAHYFKVNRINLQNMKLVNPSFLQRLDDSLQEWMGKPEISFHEETKCKRQDISDYVFAINTNIVCTRTLHWIPNSFFSLLRINGVDPLAVVFANGDEL